jgi:hypothetical protein
MASFWDEVGKQAAPGIAQAAVRSAAESIQARGDIMRLFVHDYAVTKEIQREATARGWGIQDATNFRAPYGQLTVNANTQQASAPAAPAEPAKKSSLLKNLAMAALIGTGGGGLVAAGGLGAYSLLKEQLNRPVQIDPAAFKTKISFDPEKGIQVGELEPAK